MGLCATRNFYISHKENDGIGGKNVSLGVWHILPSYIAKTFAKELRLSEVIYIFYLSRAF